MYRNVFHVPKQRVEGLDPSTIASDFEIGAVNAAEAEFPGVEIQGCFCHLCQNVFITHSIIGAAGTVHERPELRAKNEDASCPRIRTTRRCERLF